MWVKSKIIKQKLELSNQALYERKKRGLIKTKTTNNNVYQIFIFSCFSLSYFSCIIFQDVSVLTHFALLLFEDGSDGDDVGEFEPHFGHHLTLQR